MIQRIGAGVINYNTYNNIKSSAPAEKNTTTLPSFSQNYTATSLVNAYQAFHGITPASTVSFGKGFADVFDDMNKQMFTCRSESNKGEEVGKNINISNLVNKYYKDLRRQEDAVKTNVTVKEDTDRRTGKVTVVESRTQLKQTVNGLMFEMAVRQPREKGTKPNMDLPLRQLIRITQDPHEQEKTYVLNTRGNLMAVAEDGENVLLTNAGRFHKHKYVTGERLSVNAQLPGVEFRPFTPAPQEVEDRKPSESQGEGTEIVIGMEQNRFVPEIIDSIETFVKKVENEEIVLKPFVANPEAKNTQLAMLAGGFGSRAEYTNASSSGIFHGEKDGAQSTKGVFRTATGLTPMETTFITLHNAGLLDCSKGKIGIGKNIKFYLNKSGVNKGNGGFTVDLYNLMDREGRNSLTLFPNDSMSRMTNATKKMTEIMNSGNAALVMIAKEVNSNDAKGNFGIMKLGNNNEILEFAEKPKEIPAGYEHNGKCLTNTFQFSVSKEAFKALSMIEEYFPEVEGKEPKDWSKTYVPILMSLTQKNDIKEITKDITKIAGADYGVIPEPVVRDAKLVLGNQKIIAVPTDEPWADCGTLNQLYHTTMQIASNDFPLEDFERKHVLDSINTQTGLVASSPEQKAAIEAKYDIIGEVMAVPIAKKIDKKIVEDYEAANLISVNHPKKK